jgi:hypothetical protein
MDRWSRCGSQEGPGILFSWLQAIEGWRQLDGM